MITKSSPEEIVRAEELVKNTEEKIRSLIESGKKVHIIWDFDFVLSSGRSDDIFVFTGFNLVKYFEYEARLSWQRPEYGIWLKLATQVGRLQSSQDIVTARSSYLAFRVMYFCMMLSEDPNWIRWMLFLGHQAKSESFRIILESLRKDPDFFIIYVDDAKKHIDSFTAICKELKFEDRALGVLSPQIRLYGQEELEAHYNAVMGAQGDKPVIIPHEKEGHGGFTVLPNGLKDFRRQAMSSLIELHQEAVVEANRETLESFHGEVMPDKPKTTDNLYHLFELLRESSR